MAEQTPAGQVPSGSPEIRLTLSINGAEVVFGCDPRTTLLDALRDHALLPGTKKGCDRGQCGACTVLLDDRRVVSCLVFAVAAQGHRVTTIEGMSATATGSDMQQAFVDCDALQCGYCTPGQICSAVGMVDEIKRGWPSAVTKDLTSENTACEDDEIRERLSGNICRCGAYVNILAAVRGVVGAVDAPEALS